MSAMATSPMSPERFDPNVFMSQAESLDNPSTPKRKSRSGAELADVLKWAQDSNLGKFGYELQDLADARDAGITATYISNATKWAETVHEGEEKSLRAQLSITDRTNLGLILGAYTAATHETNALVEQGLQDALETERKDALEAERKDAELQAQLEANAGEDGKKDLAWVKAGLSLHQWKKSIKKKAKADNTYNTPLEESAQAVPPEPEGDEEDWVALDRDLVEAFEAKNVRDALLSTMPTEPQEQPKREKPDELSATRYLGNKMQEAIHWLETNALSEVIKMDPSLKVTGLGAEMIGRDVKSIVKLKLVFDYTISRNETEEAARDCDDAWAECVPAGQKMPRWMELLRKLAETKRAERLARERQDNSSTEELAA